METWTKVLIWVAVGIIALLVAGFEILGLATPLWHTISWYSQKYKVLAVLILLFFLALPAWWIHHIWFTTIPKLGH